MPLIDFHRLTLEAYLDRLSRRQPVPGGGSAAALTSALGVGLVSMVGHYSIGRRSNTKAVQQRLGKIVRKSEAIRKRLLELTSLDAQAYLKIVDARKQNAKIQKQAGRRAAAVGREVCRLCYQAMDLTHFLAAEGNPHLISDIEVAIELLQAGFNSSMIMVRINQ